MRELFHFAHPDSIDQILTEGLVPGNSPHNIVNMPQDPEYVHLVKDPKVKNMWQKMAENGYIALQVYLDDDHPLEPDLEASRFITTVAFFPGMPLMHAVSELEIGEAYYEALESFEQEVLSTIDTKPGKDFHARCMDSIARYPDLVEAILAKASPEKWAEHVSLYRTQTPIPFERVHLNSIYPDVEEEPRSKIPEGVVRKHYPGFMLVA